MTADPVWSVITFVARASLPLLGAALLAASLRRRPATLRHATWAAGLCATLVVLVLTVVNVPAIAHLPSIDVRATATLARGDHLHVASRALQPTDVRFVEKTSSHGAADGSSGAPGTFSIILTVWLAGVALSLTRLARSHHAAAALAAHSREPNASVLRCWNSIVNRQRRRHRVRLGVGELSAPATVGVFRHVVLIPARAESWDEASLRQVFEHELAHVRRCDGLVDLMGALALAVHWYHPLVHRVVKAMAVERERACDDIVLMGGASPRAYAKLLLVNAAALRGCSSSAPVLAFAGRSELETRLRAVLDEQVPRGRLSRRSALACFAFALLAALLLSAIQVEASPLDTATSIMARPESDERTRLDADSSRRLPAGEPDLRADSVASPQSERLGPQTPGANHASNRVWRSTSFEAGPDAHFAELLGREAARAPSDRVDLVPERSAWALQIARDGRLIEPLVDLVEDRDWRVRAHAVWALGVAGQTARRDSRAQPRLVRALEDPVWRVRSAAAFALREVGDSTVIPALTRALGDAAWQVRVPAIEGLAAIGGARTRTLLKAMLHDRHSMVRETAATSLAPAIATSRR